MSIDELAARADLPARTIREYQTMRVLPGPAKRGRSGVYDDSHLARLRTIDRLQSRGYSLAGIRDLFEAWSEGRDLLHLLDEPDIGIIHEAPRIMTKGEVLAEVDDVPSRRFMALVDSGVVARLASGRYCVPAPSLLRLVDDAVRAGIELDDALAVARAVSDGAAATAASLTSILNTALGDRDDEAVTVLIRRGRGLLAAAAGRLLIHELGAALGERADLARNEPQRSSAGVADQYGVRPQ